MCHRLSELGLDYAEAAQREGLRDLTPRPERAFWRPTPTCHPARPQRETPRSEVFSTLSRCVRQAILLEARLDSDAYDRPPFARATPAESAPRKSSAQPRTGEPGDGTGLEYERLEDDLAADANRPADDILIEICQKLGQALDALPATSQARLAMPRTYYQSVPSPRPAHKPQPNRPPDKPPPESG